MTNLVQPRENTALEVGDPATTTPAATDCWDVATLDPSAALVTGFMYFVE